MSRIACVSCPNCRTPVGFFTERQPGFRSHYCTECKTEVGVYA